MRIGDGTPILRTELLPARRSCGSEAKRAHDKGPRPYGQRRDHQPSATGMSRSAGPSQLVSIDPHRPNSTKVAATSVRTSARNSTPIFWQMVTSSACTRSDTRGSATTRRRGPFMKHHSAKPKIGTDRLPRPPQGALGVACVRSRRRLHFPEVRCHAGLDIYSTAS